MQGKIRSLKLDLDTRFKTHLGPTHVLEPEVPVANVEAFFETCDTLTFEV